MQELPKYPFELATAFFLRLEFRRSPHLEGPVTTVWSTTIRVDDRSYPSFDVSINVEASPNQPFSFTTELVGKFNVAQDMAAPPKNILAEFLSEQGIFMLWPYVVQAVAQASAQMGMPIINIQTPIKWHLSPLSPSPSASPSPEPTDE